VTGNCVPLAGCHSVEEPGQMRLRAHAARGCDMSVQAYSEAADSRNKREHMAGSPDALCYGAAVIPGLL